jgi:hypothetical protein
MFARKQTLNLLTVEGRRAWVLRLLNEATHFSLNEILLQSMLVQVGHSSPAHVIRNDMLWLKSLQLIEIQTPRDVWIAVLTVLGVDVAVGRFEAYGIAKLPPTS